MKLVFVERSKLESMIVDIMKLQGLSREEAVKEIESMVQAHEPESTFVVTEQFSSNNVEFKKAK